MNDDRLARGAAAPVHFGAVYFRGGTLPEKDWERDYERAAADGITLFRHWFSWGAIERAPGEYHWERYDRLLELGAKYKIATVIGEFSEHAPEWFMAAHPDGIREDRHGRKRSSDMTGSAVIGGAHCMCMDNEDTREGVLRFLTALGERYKGHPGLYGYDVWNECTMYTPELLCHCPASQERFRLWLKEKYRDLETLNRAWFRHSYTSWDQIHIPRIVGIYPEVFDAVRFRGDTEERWFALRAETLRNADPNHLITAHGYGMAHRDMATNCGDDWRYAKHTDSYGYTFWYGNHCDPMLGGDMTRSASGGKAFWRAEAVGNEDWNARDDTMAPQLAKDEMSDPRNIRLDAMKSLICGATGFITPRYRPLSEGELFHAYGWYAPDGERTDRSEMASSLANWCNAPEQNELWKAKPMKGEAAILLDEDSQALCYAMHKSAELYAACVKGAHHAFLDSNIQCDIIRIHQIDEYDLLYVPYPLAISDETAKKLAAWVNTGGVLISEGLFGYFDDKGHAMDQQPNRGFDRVFGCVQKHVHLGPDRNRDLTLFSDRGVIRGGCYRQSYDVTAGTVLGTHESGEAALVSNQYGKGRTLLIGTMPGYGYDRGADEGTRRWFASLLELAGKRPRVSAFYNSGVVLRVWENGGAKFLWALNTGEHRQTVSVDLSFGRPLHADFLRGTGGLADSGILRIEVGGRDAAVVRMNG